MAWQGVWFEPLATPGGGRDPELLSVLMPPIVYPYAHSFVNAEQERVRQSRDPGTIWSEGEYHRVYYSLCHDSRETGMDEQGCRILRWLFESFDPDSTSTVAARFSEIPVVIHADHPAKAAAMANALALMRFLTAEEDQAIAKIMVFPWDVHGLGPGRAAAIYEEHVRSFLAGSVLYPEDVNLFDVLARNDLRGHREFAACCTIQIGFIRSLLDWIDEAWPETTAERADLETKLRNSLIDEARFLRQDG